MDCSTRRANLQRAMRWRGSSRNIASSSRRFHRRAERRQLRMAPAKTNSFFCAATGERRESERHATCPRSEEHTSELQSRQYLVCRLLLEKKKKKEKKLKKS